MLRQAVSRGRDTPRYCAASSSPQLRRPRSSPTLPSSPASRRTARKTRSRAHSPSAAVNRISKRPDVVSAARRVDRKGGRPGALHRFSICGRKPDLLEADNRLANGRGKWRASGRSRRLEVRCMRFRERKKLVEAMRSPPVEETALGLREPDGATVEGPAATIRGIRRAIQGAPLQPCPDNSPLACAASAWIEDRRARKRRGDTMPNKIDLAGRFAVVTGGAQGIGRAIVERLLDSGAAVAIWDRDRALRREDRDGTCKSRQDSSRSPCDVTELAGRRARPRRHREGVRPHRHPGEQRRHRGHERRHLGLSGRRMGAR